MSKKEEKIKDGDVVDGKWKILQKLGEGGFGAVYRVSSSSTKEEYAMKVEPLKMQESMLKMEVAVFKTFRNTGRPQPHVCKFIENGQTTTIVYLVMQLVGRSLADLRRACPDEKFSGSTTTRLSMQALESIEALHSIGFLHRDIKPANFAMGRNAQVKTVYVLDFGLARQYVNKENKLRPARQAAGFRGTVRYASINTHQRKDLGRHDDLWSLFYMMVEFHQGQLPWRKDKDKADVLKKKLAIGAPVLLKGMDKEYTLMMEKLQKYTYDTTPEYEWFRKQIKAIMSRNNSKDEDPFDWDEGGGGYESVMQSAIAPNPYKKKEKADKKYVKEKLENEEKSQSDE